MHATTRLTTREVAQTIGCTLAEALHLLKAAQVENTRCGGAYLWDAEGVDRLLVALKTEPQNGRTGKN